MAPKVSVIMAVYNGERFVREAIDSILAQTFGDFELIIVDDGSADGTLQILASYGDPRLRVLRNASNIGQARARNRALAIAQGELIAIQDADDVSLPERLGTQVSFLDAQPEVGVLGSSWRAIDVDGNDLGSIQVLAGSLEIGWRLLFTNCLCHSTVMYRRALISEIGAYPEDQEFRFSEDYHLWCRAAKVTKIFALPTPLVKYRETPGSATGANIREQLRQAGVVAKSYMATFLDGYPIDDSLWSGVTNFWIKHPSDPTILTASQAWRLASFLPMVESRFHAAWKGGDPERILRHRRRLYWMWAKHALAMTYRYGDAGMIGRAALALSGARFLARACSPPRANTAEGPHRPASHAG
jgi:glycosyltransferase involved in cell wall biosynthesis